MPGRSRPPSSSSRPGASTSVRNVIYSEPIPVMPEELLASTVPYETGGPAAYHRAEPLPTGPELALLAAPIVVPDSVAGQ